MIRSILKLKPRQGETRALVRYFEEENIVGSALSVPGCLAVEVQTRLPDGGDVVVTALWSSIQSYEAWLSSQDRQRSGAGMLPLLADGGESIAPARLYRVEQSGRPTYPPADPLTDPPADPEGPA